MKKLSINNIFIILLGAALIRGRHSFQHGYPKVQRLLEGSTHFNMDTQKRSAYLREALISTWIPKSAALIRARRSFQHGYPKVQCLLERGTQFNMDTQKCGAY